ncbi:branched-chain amino acid ABC transporter permease/ATP-binding protein [Dermatobacter hominis]|uniref:branched-chain amino acid ABC transporter permease/ATP-binding protein n=1 Tax=Dermatobacter hominis TaxID=2884263 RepID=UPI001D0FFDC4|nr:branched-chain amino acid ABC transporter permease/ATP-binding protein [Dermatobacter hominis]UDY36638.1 ATP-binding cassette domain-containing protein [Dermatobacter hominis]
MNHLGNLLLGIGNGGVFAALAVALVITYRSSGVVNFATGAISLTAAYIYAGLRKGELLLIVPGLPRSVDVGAPLNFASSALIALAIAGAIGALLHLLVFRPMRNAPQLAKAVASLGVLVVLQGTLATRFGTAPISVAPLFRSERWELGSVGVLSDRFYLAVTVLALTLLLAAAYRFTRFGLLTRAAAESQTGAYISRISPDRIALANWVISAVVAGIAGILIAPLSPLTPITYTLFVVPALAAAVIGRFEYLLVAAVAGLGIGMLQSEATSMSNYDWMPATGGAELVPLIVIIIALLVAGRDMPARSGLVRQPLGRAPRPRSLLTCTVAGTAVGVIALVATSGEWRAAVIASMIAGVIALSLVVVTGYAGQVSLAQLAFAGAAAFTLSAVTTTWDLPFPIAPIVAALVATVVGVLVGLPALRLRGVALGVVTLALAYAIEAVWFRNTDIVGTSGANIEPPSLFGIDLGVGVGAAFPRIEFGLLCLVTLVGVALGVALLRRSALGSAMLAIRANERSAAGVGVNVTRVKVITFAISSFIAGLGGCLMAYRRTTVTFESFTALGGLALLATVYLAGITSVWGGVLAGILASAGIVFFLMGRIFELGGWYDVITGALLVVTLITNPEGLALFGHKLAERLHLRRTATAAEPTAPTAIDLVTPVEPRRTAGPAELVVGDLSVHYGGVTAVSHVSFDVPPGSVVGLIGPNGAGKTSVIDAVTGFARADGSVRLGDADVSRMPPHVRVRRGIARTFQSLELYDDLSVEENVSVAAEGLPPGERGDAITAALVQAGISGLRARAAGDLSQGERQLVSIARACVTNPRVLLLDEPAAGLDRAERLQLSDRIRHIADAGTGVLLVDHDVSLVLGVCQRIIVLDFGAVIAAGTPEEIRNDRMVAEAYLGGVHDESEVPA